MAIDAAGKPVHNKAWRGKEAHRQLFGVLDRGLSWPTAQDTGSVRLERHAAPCWATACGSIWRFKGPGMQVIANFKVFISHRTAWDSDMSTVAVSASPVAAVTQLQHCRAAARASGAVYRIHTAAGPQLQAAGRQAAGQRRLARLACQAAGFGSSASKDEAAKLPKSRDEAVSYEHWGGQRQAAVELRPPLLYTLAC